MKFFGRAQIVVNGETLESKPGASIDLGGIQRASVVNDNSMGYTETPMPSKLEIELALKQGDSIEKFRDITDGTASFACDTGQSYVIKDIYTAEPPSIAGNGGTVKLTLNGGRAEEVVS